MYGYERRHTIVPPNILLQIPIKSLSLQIYVLNENLQIFISSIVVYFHSKRKKYGIHSQSELLNISHIQVFIKAYLLTCMKTYLLTNILKIFTNKDKELCLYYFFPQMLFSSSPYILIIISSHSLGVFPINFHSGLALNGEDTLVCDISDISDTQDLHISEISDTRV